MYMRGSILQVKILKQAGFGLLEVLIAVVILSIGILGLASLQSRSIQSLQEGDNLVNASIIAKEVAQRMLANPYVTAQGRQGYLLTDLNNEVGSDVAAWAASTLASNPDAANCYTVDNASSCFAVGADINDSSDIITAFNNMEVIDQVELRLLAANTLPQGQIKICFDSADAFTDWECDDVATRIASRNENVFTVKVQWNNLFTNSSQIYALQFTAECTNGDATHCGN